VKLEFSRQIFEKKIPKYQISWKSVELEPTDVTKLTVGLRSYERAKTRWNCRFTESSRREGLQRCGYITVWMLYVGTG